MGFSRRSCNGFYIRVLLLPFLSLLLGGCSPLVDHIIKGRLACNREYPQYAKYVCSPKVKAWNCDLCFYHISKLEAEIHNSWKVREIGK